MDANVAEIYSGESRSHAGHAEVYNNTYRLIS